MPFIQTLDRVTKLREKGFELGHRGTAVDLLLRMDFAEDHNLSGFQNIAGATENSEFAAFDVDFHHVRRDLPFQAERVARYGSNFVPASWRGQLLGVEHFDTFTTELGRHVGSVSVERHGTDHIAHHAADRFDPIAPTIQADQAIKQVERRGRGFECEYFTVRSNPLGGAEGK
jgi:hypothetical protein